MRQFDTYTYGVKPGEEITLSTHLIALPQMAVQVSKTMQKGPATPDGSPTWTFTVPTTGAEEVYNAFAEVSFVAAPTNARVDITVEGSLGGGAFSIFPIFPTSADKDPGFTFWVE